MSPPRMLLLAAAAFFPAIAPLRATPALDALRAQLALASNGNEFPEVLSGTGDRLAQIELLRRILDLDPADDRAHRTLIELWLSLPDYDLAEATLNAWPAAPADLAALTRAAIQQNRDKDVPGAIRTLRAYLATAPDDLTAQSALVDTLLTTDDYAAQLAALDRLITMHRDSEALLHRANARFHLGDYPGALADARAAQQLEPDSDFVKSSLPAFERLAETLAARPPLDAALAKNPRDFSALIERAWWLRYGGILDRSLADADAALAIDPNSLAAKITRARARFLLDQVKAEDVLRDESIDVNRAHSSEAILALAAADQALAQDPRDVTALGQRAHALNDAGQFRLVRNHADVALALAPRNADVALESLYATEMLGEDPAPLLRQIEAMKPPKAKLALANTYLADLYLRQGRLPLALQFADASLGFGETVYALRLKAAVLQRLGRPDEAAVATRRADALPQ